MSDQNDKDTSPRNPAEEQAANEYKEMMAESERQFKEVKDVTVYIYDRGGLWVYLSGEHRKNNLFWNEFNTTDFEWDTAKNEDIAVMANEFVRSLLPPDFSFRLLNPLHPKKRTSSNRMSDFFFIAELTGESLPDKKEIIHSKDGDNKLTWLSLKELKEITADDAAEQGLFESWMNLDFLKPLIDEWIAK